MATIDDILGKNGRKRGEPVNVAASVSPAAPVIVDTTPAPVASPVLQDAATTVAPAKRSLTYSQMFDALNPAPTDEDLQKLKKRDKANRVVTALGDGLSALANLYYTTKGAPSAQLSSASDRYLKLYNDAVAKHRADMDAYRKGKWNAYMQDVLQGDKDRTYGLNVRKADDANARAEAKLDYSKEKDKQTAERLAARDAAADAFRKEQLAETKRNNAAMQQYRAGSLGVAQQKAVAAAEKNAGKRETGTIQLYDRNGKPYPVYEKDWRYVAPQLVDVIEKATGTKLDLASDIGIGVTPLDKQLAYVSEHWVDVPEAVEMVKRMRAGGNSGASPENRSAIGWDDSGTENKIGW